MNPMTIAEIPADHGEGFNLLSHAIDACLTRRMKERSSIFRASCLPAMAR
jgi:hypothetical protein